MVEGIKDILARKNRQVKGEDKKIYNKDDGKETLRVT